MTKRNKPGKAANAIVRALHPAYRAMLFELCTHHKIPIIDAVEQMIQGTHEGFIRHKQNAKRNEGAQVAPSGEAAAVQEEAT